MNPTLALVGVVIGAALTHIFHYIQFKRQRQVDAKKLRLAKLEELLEILSEIHHSYVCLHTRYSHLTLPSELAEALRSKYDHPADNSGKRVPIAKMQMLIAIYVPTLQSVSDQVMAMRAEFGDLIVNTTSADSLSATERQELWQKWCIASKRMEQLIADAQFEVARLASTTTMVD